ncbi:Crp/Fnr family transcriptional regulator [Brevundimonas nasdae]|uniref:Crp/Fnr family transcriptional regulator n=1 Tax=Brevundimonas nasdae TaxID=172043 RepID=A0ABX8TIP8_9CAUL|nr:Crp/Fnr family transcriptional regulator [Brevundimonas nasdae]QYC13464.1 Crp/Fnr family transcriptional regulator [Brevundimonas nasdae]
MLHALAGGVRQVHARGDIQREGASPQFLTLVLEGWACTYRDLENGQRQILSVLLPGDLVEPFGILPAFADHSIGAVTQVTLAQIPPHAIRATARVSPRIEQALWWDLLVAIAIEREHTVSLGRRTASERLGHLFCELHLRQQIVGLCDHSRCDLLLTQSELADLLGLSAVHVNRSLQDMRSRGLVSLRNRQLIIHDLTELRDFSFFDPNYLHADTARSSSSPEIQWSAQ